MARQLVYEFDIDGEKIIIDFGLKCWEVFCEEMDIPMEGIINSFQGGQQIKAAKVLFYAGLCSYHFVNRMPFNMSKEDVEILLNNRYDIVEKTTEFGLNELLIMISEAKLKDEKKKKVSPSRSKKSKK